MLKNIWWPLFGNFNNLHPEYEVIDYMRRSRFLDYAYIPNFVLIGLEGDGYEFHGRNLTREQFSYERNRDTFLTGLGWRLIHFFIR